MNAEEDWEEASHRAEEEMTMGLLDRLTGKKDSEKGPEPEKKKEVPEGKYDEPCSLCGNPGTEKKWLGQYWHKKCLRQVKKGAKKMI